MMIEIRGVECKNKGAYLMLLSILDQVRKTRKDDKITVKPHDDTEINFDKLIQHGLFPKMNFNHFNKLRQETIKRLFSGRRNVYGLVADEEVDVILDASGFAYGDYWGMKKMRRRILRDIDVVKNRGGKVILLPQAFGPFNNKALKRGMNKIIKNADLIYARDPVSYTYLREINDKESVKLAPDFTSLMEVPLKSSKKGVAIIPNHKMIANASPDNVGNYLNFLTELIQLLQNEQQDVFFLIHEGNDDYQLAEQVNSMLAKEVAIWKSDNPLAIKQRIGNSRLVITSRYHGLMSALFQSVPVFATSWSHKYEMVLKEYEMDDHLIDPNDSSKMTYQKIIGTLNSIRHNEISAHLNKKAEDHKLQSRKMWDEIFYCIAN
ncbi:MAG: polysaccharide pyruvyl transferase family protein [Balneolales bacterium]